MLNVVGYVRLSRDEDKENYSSIISQQDIIHEYAKGRNWDIKYMYIDDNCSGYTFNRPAFSEMISELEAGKIDVVIAKDLSRVGRNNGQVLVLIDRFIEINKRLILINEANGGLDILEDNTDILGIKTWYNEMYIKDISRKIRTNMSNMQKKGELIMGNYYGYKKIKVNDKVQLLIDEEIKSVIELIFKHYINGLGYKKICDILDKEKFPTPSEYIKMRFEAENRVFKNSVTSKWQTHMIQRIILDDVYAGVLRTKKKQSKYLKGKQKKVPKEEQYVFENHHEAMIAKDIFELAQKINAKKKVVHHRGSAKYNYIFSSFVKCSDCGHAAGGKKIKYSHNPGRVYECLMYQKYGLKGCTAHTVREEDLLLYFKEFLKDAGCRYSDYIEKLNFTQKKKDISKSMDKLNKELNVLNDELKMLLNQKIRDLIKETNLEYKQIIEDTYSNLENDKKERISKIIGKIEELKNINISNVENNVETAMKVFDDIINAEVPERKLLEMVLDKIMLNKDKTIEFKLKVNIDQLTYGDLTF
jgi:site-specific DNA recombinase